MATLRDIGLSFFIGGLLILLGYGGVKIVVEPDTPFFVKLGFLALFIGVIILIITLIREQTTEDDDGVDRKY